MEGLIVRPGSADSDRLPREKVGAVLDAVKATEVEEISEGVELRMLCDVSGLGREISVVGATALVVVATALPLAG